VTERLLDAVEIRTCGDIYTHRATLALLDKYLHMRDKLYIYLGLGTNQIKPWAREARKSVGAERSVCETILMGGAEVRINRTFRAIDEPAKIQEKLELVARELESDLERLGFAGHTITLKVKLDTFERQSWLFYLS
jgi:DNA polymerase kappa